ncbi:MAG: autotransporter outer membrane beta-barrel domain-containing protein [Elusimicrobiales bacterium]|nr:autotransporter outer membrane beta-barrel domain-containing protein [Elusimicrobiales bacterium]
MDKKTSVIFCKRALAGFLSAMLVAGMSVKALAQVDPLAEQITDHFIYSVAMGISDQNSFMSFSLNDIGNQTLFAPAAAGLNSGDVCGTGACVGNLHIKAFANSDNLRDSDMLDDNAGVVAAFSTDRIYDAFDARYSVFGGYMISRMKYEASIGTKDHHENNIPFAGLSAEFYKGHFFGGFVLNGAYAHTKTMFEGADDRSSDSWMGGAGVKAGYNMNLFSHFALQPFGKASYTYFKMENQETPAGEIDFHAMHGVSLAPGMKGVLNLGKCWELAGFGNYVWDYMTYNDVKADSTADEMLNYVEYGLGLQKKWSSVILSANGKRREGKRYGWYADLNLEVRF